MWLLISSHVFPENFIEVAQVIQKIEIFSFNINIAIFQVLKKQPPEGFCKKSVLKKFRKIHQKTPVLDSLFKRFSGLRPGTLLKKRLQHRCFQVNFVTFLRTPFSQNTSVICSNLLLLEKWTKLTILLSFVLANTFYTLLWMHFIDQNINTWNHISSMR